MPDPNLHWDGGQWLRRDGTEWAPDPQQPAPTPTPPTAKSHLGIIVAAIAGGLAFLLVVAGGTFWLLTRGDGSTTAGGETTSITTVPINGTQDSFTDSVGVDQQIRSKTTDQPVTVPGSEAGLYGGTKNVSSCDPGTLIAFLMANPQKAQAWAGVLGIEPSGIPTYVIKLTPLLLRSDTLVMNHGYANGQATSFLSVLQAGSAVLVGRRGLPVVRCYCGNPLTQPPLQVPTATYTGPTWPGWNPQSIAIVTQNITFIDIFIVFDPETGDLFTRPAGTAGSEDGSKGTTRTTPVPSPSGPDYSAEVSVLLGFLNAVAAGDYAEGWATSEFVGRIGGIDGLAPGWGALNSYGLVGIERVGDSVAVTVREHWDGGTRTSTYYVVASDGTTLIGDADLGATGYDHETQPPATDQPTGYPRDYPTQYPDDGETYDDSVG
ncbi:MAG: DUF6777 domain-containing protein [Candidatus Nanopelagicales bacterium]